MRFRIRTLMSAVAIVGLVMALAPLSWRARERALLAEQRAIAAQARAKLVERQAKAVQDVDGDQDTSQKPAPTAREALPHASDRRF